MGGEIWIEANLIEVETKLDSIKVPNPFLQHVTSVLTSQYGFSICSNNVMSSHNSDIGKDQIIPQLSGHHIALHAMVLFVFIECSFHLTIYFTNLAPDQIAAVAAVN